MNTLSRAQDLVAEVPTHLLLVFAATTVFGFCVIFYLTIFIVAPIPRPPSRAEKTYRAIEPDGQISHAKELPCWQDGFNARRKAAQNRGDFSNTTAEIEAADVLITVIIPAYNEQDRLGTMLTEAVEYLETEYPPSTEPMLRPNPTAALQRKGSSKRRPASNGSHVPPPPDGPRGWEILLVSDGSTDRTVQTGLEFARAQKPETAAAIRVISLQENRGKGGAVTHGMRHVRGQYAIFADADGASKFSDLAKLVRACQRVEDGQGRGVAVGSRAHLVGSEAVVKRSRLRNFLMHSFHVFLRILTPPATAAIRDTQCGFKLFSRPSLPYIIPYMHSEGWIFDVEMLMLAESAGIPVVEVPVGWKEVTGSKLNILWASLAMAWGLAILRAAWSIGIYRR